MNEREREFFMALFPAWPADCWAEVRPIRKGEPVKSEWLRSVTGVLDAAARLSPTHECYFGVNLRRGHNGTKEGVACGGCFHCDLDVPLPEARKRLDTFELPPSAVVSSGNGAHAYWFLREPYPIESPEDVARLDAINRALAHVLGGDKGAWDISRVLRVPGTVSHKRGGVPVELVEFHPDLRYDPWDFERLGYSLPPGAAADVSFTDADVDAEAALAKAHPLSSEVRRLITEGHAGDADRSVGDFRVCCDLARAVLSDDEVRAIFAHYPIGAKYAEAGDRYLSLTLGKARAAVAEETLNVQGSAPKADKVAVLTTEKPPSELPPKPEAPLGGLKERTAAELLEGEGETLEVDFLPLLGEDGFIVRGWSHILASYPKTGKTELLADAVAKWTGEGLRVLYFTEEPEAVWRLRLRSRRPLKPENLTLAFGLLAGVEAVEARIAAGNEEVVIVDTTRNVLGQEDEKDNSAIARTCGPLIAKCRLGSKTLIFAHHHVKAGGEYGRGIAGGHAFLGIVDVALEINREKTANRRRLEGQARIVTVPALLYEMAEDGTFTALGAPEDVGAEEVQGRVGDVLTDEWQLTGTIRKALDDPEKPMPSADSVRRALDALARRGEAERKPPMSEGSKPGAKYLWRATTSPPL